MKLKRAKLTGTNEMTLWVHPKFPNIGFGAESVAYGRWTQNSLWDLQKDEDLVFFEGYKVRDLRDSDPELMSFLDRYV